MNAGTSLRENLRRQTGEARRRQAQAAAEIDRRLDRPPEPVDLVVLAETAEHPVEWAILERDPSDPRRLLAVPADISSLAGSADVAVDVPRPLTLRCAHAAWLDAGALTPENRTGLLEPEIVERARTKRDAVERGEAVGSLIEREVDDEAEYLEWTEVLEGARQAVTAVGAHGCAPERSAEPETGRSGNVVPLRRPSRWRTSSNLLALAASILLVSTLGLGRQLMTSAREHRLAVAEQRAELERLEQERQRAAEDHRQELTRLQDEQQRTQAEHQQRIAELEASTRPRAMVNLPLIILASSQLRGGPESIEVAPDAASLMLILQVEDPRAFPRYRLEIREQASGRRVWSDSRLEPSRLSELTVLLPRNLLPDGRYQLHLFGLRGSGAEKLMERILTLTTG